MRNKIISVLALVFLGLVTTSAAAQTQRELVKDLIAWVAADGEDGVLDGRLAKAMGIGAGEDVAVKARRMLSRQGGRVSRLMVPVGSELLIVRQSVGGGQEVLWKASLVRDQSIATLEAALFVDWTGKIRVDKVNPTRGDDGFFAATKQWHAERQKDIRKAR